MKRLATALAAIYMALMFTACPQGPKAPGASTVEQASAETNTPPSTKLTAVELDVPVAADFEEEAAQEITEDNYARALDELAAE